MSFQISFVLFNIVFHFFPFFFLEEFPAFQSPYLIGKLLRAVLTFFNSTFPWPSRLLHNLYATCHMPHAACRLPHVASDQLKGHE